MGGGANTPTSQVKVARGQAILGREDCNVPIHLIAEGMVMLSYLSSRGLGWKIIKGIIKANKKDISHILKRRKENSSEEL